MKTGWRAIGLILFLAGLATVASGHPSLARVVAGSAAVAVGSVLLVTGGRR